MESEMNGEQDGWRAKLKTKRAVLGITLAGCIATTAAPAFAHVVLDVDAGKAGSYFRAEFRVGHGCGIVSATGPPVSSQGGLSREERKRRTSSPCPVRSRR